MNHVILVGRLGADPDLRKTKQDTSVCEFRLATDERIGGEKRTEWHSVKCWAQLADLCDKYLGKGDLVGVTGRIEYRQWDNKEGVTQYKTEIRADRVQFLVTSGKAQREAAENPATPPPPF